MSNTTKEVILSKESLDRLKLMLAPAAQRIIILSHTNPDGDAVGSSLAWCRVLESLGHSVMCVVPNRYPYFLNWVPRIDDIKIFKESADEIVAAVKEADLIFCLDFNILSRLEALSDAINENSSAKRILIDHHLSPPSGYDLMFSHPESSSTSYIVALMIEQMFGFKVVTREMAEALYVGMMTDTGNFSFSTLTPELFRMVAKLLETGIHIPTLYNNVYNGYTEGRARLFGYVIDKKMGIIHNGEVAYMSLKENEMRRYGFQQGDSEGFVNYPLTVKKMKMSAMFLATRKFIRVSLRSRGAVDVNVFARRYFEGGGHANAAGGKSFRTMEETIEYFRTSVEEYFAEIEGAKE
jgi:phosphoesterase RecJ-like protein